MFFGYGPEVSYQILSASGVVNDSAKPQALYRAAVAGGATTTVVTFFNGISSLGTAVYAFTGVASGTAIDNPGIGLVFPGGCYVSFDASTTKVTTWCRQVQNV